MIYLAGPISGYDELEREATFACAATKLRTAGNMVVNPFEVHPAGVPWNTALRADIRAMMDCDEIHLLLGWEKSNGVRLELNIALSLGFKVSLEQETV